MAADKIIRNSKLDTFLSKLATKLTAIFWRKAETTQVAIDATPTASSNNLVKSGGVKSYVDNAIPSVPAISTDISTDASSDTKTASPKAVYTYVGNPIISLAVPSTPDGTIIATHLNGDTDTIDLNHTHSQYALKVEVETSQPAGGMAPNTLYNLGTLSGAVTFAFAAPTDNTILNEYMFTFDSGSTAAVPTWPNTITNWLGNCLDQNGVPEIAASKHYEVSVIGAYGYINEF